MKKIIFATLVSLGLTTGCSSWEKKREKFETEMIANLETPISKLNMLEKKCQVEWTKFERMERAAKLYPKDFEKYCNALHTLYSKASHEPDKLTTANRIADCLLGDRAEAQTEYVIWTSGFAENHKLTKHLTPEQAQAAVEKKYGLVRTYLGFTAKKIEELVKNHYCKLCGAYLHDYYMPPPPSVLLTSLHCPQNIKEAWRPSNINYFYNSPNFRFNIQQSYEKVILYGEHQRGEDTTRVRYEDIQALLNDRSIRLSEIPQIEKNSLVLVSGGKLEIFPTTNEAKLVMNYLNNLKK